MSIADDYGHGWLAGKSSLQAEADLMKSDLYAIGKALGISAKPYSGHEAVQRDFLPRIRALLQAQEGQSAQAAQPSKGEESNEAISPVDSSTERALEQGRAQAPAPAIDLVAHLHRQHDWSERTFGPGHRTQGVLDHIRKELGEIERAPLDLSEWIDVAILALDGAWRAGYSPEHIAAALVGKQARNEARHWPDWRTADPNKAIEHDRSEDVAAAPSSPGPEK